MSPEERASRIEATMQQVRDGSWRINVDGLLVLSTYERALWQQAAAAVDPEAIGGAQENAALAMTAKIFKSITTRLIQKPSQVRAAASAAPKTNIPGRFIVTTSRLVFTSKERTFITRFENIGDMCSTLEGIRFFEHGKSAAYAVKYDEPNGDIISQMIDFCMAEAARA